MTQLDIHEAREKLADLVARARAGEEVIILEQGKTAVRLVVVEPAAPQADANEPEWKKALMQAAGMWKDRDDIPKLMESLYRK
jgi:prevent-host-death family protein